MFSHLIKLIKILNANENPSQLASAVALSLMLAFTPLLSLHNLLVLLLLCVLRINLSMLLISFTLLSGLAWLLDPIFHQIGEAALSNPALIPSWTWAYQQDLLRLAHFNNTLTLGSFIVALLLMAPAFFLSRWLVIKYRHNELLLLQFQIVAEIQKLHFQHNHF